MKDFEISEKVKIALRDNAANMVKAFSIESGLKGIGCLSHSLQLVIKDQIFCMLSVTNLLKKCRDLCSFANKSTNFYSEMKHQQFVHMGLSDANFLNLPHSDTDTRWNSSFYMIERILKLKIALVSTLASDIGKDAKVEFYNREWQLI